MGTDWLCLTWVFFRWCVSGARRPGRGAEALERLSPSAGHSPGTLAHLDQRAARGFPSGLSGQQLPSTGPLGRVQYPTFARVCCTFTWGGMPPAPHYLSYFCESVMWVCLLVRTVESCVHICKLLLPDLLSPANMQPPHAQDHVGSPASALPTLLLLSWPLQAARPLLHREEVGLGEIRGGHFQKRKDKDRKSQPFNTEPSLKSPSPAQLLF